MSQINEERQSAKVAIEAAFADVPFPGDRPEDLVQDTTPSEREYLAPLFAGKRWEDWKDRPLEMFCPHKYSGDLIFLEPEAFRYYLPIFLLAGLFHSEDAGNLIADLVDLLVRPDTDGGRTWYSMAIGEMTEPQLRAVSQTLDFLDKHYAPYGQEFHKTVARARFSLSYYRTARK